jgi:hypothetical protein
MMTVLSAPPDAKRLPLWAYATAYTESCMPLSQPLPLPSTLPSCNCSISVMYAVGMRWLINHCCAAAWWEPANVACTDLVTFQGMQQIAIYCVVDKNPVADTSHQLSAICGPGSSGSRVP